MRGEIRRQKMTLLIRALTPIGMSKPFARGAEGKHIHPTFIFFETPRGLSGVIFGEVRDLS